MVAMKIYEKPILSILALKKRVEKISPSADLKAWRQGKNRISPNRHQRTTEWIKTQRGIACLSAAGGQPNLIGAICG